MNDGEPVVKHAERLRMLQDKHSNGNGAGTPLTIAARTWSTPKAREGSHGDSPGSNRRSLDLHYTTEHWPTPTTQDSENNGGPSQLSRHAPPLNAAVTRWPTPRASANENRTTKNAPSHGQSHGKTLAGEASGSSLLALETETGGHKHSSDCLRLNPQFVGWLMGLPLGWTDPDSPIASTDFAAWETESSRLLRRLLSQYSQNDLA